MEKYNVICLSNQLWDFPAWTNKRQVMMRLAKQGHNVLFVDPPINMGFVLLRQLWRGTWSLYRFLTQTKKEDNALIFTPVNPLPFPGIITKIHIWRIKSLAKTNFDPNLKTIFWIYHVQMRFLKEYIDQISHAILVYDCVDNYTAFPNQFLLFRAKTSKEETREQEEYLTKKADVVFASAPGLVEKLKSYRETVYFTPNVGDYEKFKVVQDIKDQLPDDVKNISRPRIGFVGALDDYKFDKQLFRKIVNDYPKFSFIVIGPMALRDKEASLTDLGLEGVTNVYFLGSRNYKVIEKYFASFDAFIIPYVLNDYTVGGCFPVKFHDALAAGLPVIVTDLPAYIPFRDVTYISKSFNEFSENIKRALNEDTVERVRARQKVAKENNWDGKVEKMLGIIDEMVRKKI